MRWVWLATAALLALAIWAPLALARSEGLIP